MKKGTSTYIVLSLIIGMIGCKKITDISSANAFNVVADKQSYNIGDTIVFSILNRSDIVILYSGKPGYNVNYRYRSYGAGIDILKFQASVSQGNKTNMGDTIYLKICNNLKSYDSTGIANASWVNISNLANWPSYSTSGYLSSGNVDISQFNTSDSVYIAFQVLGVQNAKTSQRKWAINNLTLSNTLPDGSFTPLFAPPFSTAPNATADTVPYFAFAGWAEVDMNKYRDTFSLFNTNYGAWNVGQYGINSTSIYNRLVLGSKACNSNGVAITTSYPITFDPSNVKNTPNSEGWLISSPVNLNLVRHDFPTAVVKDEVNNLAKGGKIVQSGGVYATYRLTVDSTFKSGKTYDMAFVAQNVNINQKSEVIKHISIKIN